jgi:hypothetical protein
MPFSKKGAECDCSRQAAEPQSKELKFFLFIFFTHDNLKFKINSKWIRKLLLSDLRLGGFA